MSHHLGDETYKHPPEKDILKLEVDETQQQRKRKIWTRRLQNDLSLRFHLDLVLHKLAKPCKDKEALQCCFYAFIIAFQVNKQH